MPNVWAIRTGLWSTGSTWNTGTVPTASDDVFISGSSFTVTIDQDVNVLSLNNRPSGSGAGAIAGGGSYSVASSRNIKANLNTIGGQSNATTVNITGTGTTVNITGSISGSNANNTIVVITSVSSFINISGSVAGGTIGSTNGISLGGTSNTVSINGNVSTVGPTAGSNAYGIYLIGLSNTLNITGSIIGGIQGNNSWTIVLDNAVNSRLNISGSVAGGSLSSAGGITLLSAPNGNISIIGNISGSGSPALVFNRGATLPFTMSIVGNITSFTSNAIQFGNTGQATVNITGSVSSPSISNSSIDIGSGNTNLTLNISGSVTGGPAAGVPCVNLAGNFNAININGNVTGGTNSTARGINNNSTSPVTVNGSAIATIASAINNTGTGQVTVGVVIASTSSAAISNTGATPVIYEAATFATNGVIPISGPARLRLNDNNFFSCSLDTTGYKTLINVNNISNGLPAASDVRRGTTYNFGDGVGTMAVPSASYVDTGVAVGNTSGTGVYTTASLLTTVWDTNVSALTASNSVGERLRNISTVSSTGDQLVALL
jgi:hypothetical protein